MLVRGMKDYGNGDMEKTVKLLKKLGFKNLILILYDK